MAAEHCWQCRKKFVKHPRTREPRWLTFEETQHLVVAYLPAHFSKTKCGRSIEHELARWPAQEPKCKECLDEHAGWIRALRGEVYGSLPIMPGSEFAKAVADALEAAESKQAIIESVRSYAEYRKNHSPCCRDILKLLTGGTDG